MASKFLDRLRRSLFKEGEASPGTEGADEFPESSELEDDTDCVSAQLGGRLSFEGDGALESEDAAEGSGPESDSDFLGESLDNACSSTDTSPVAPSPKSSSMLTKQLQESWRALRSRSVPDRLMFEVTDASVVQEGTSKYVLYTVQVIQAGMFDKTPALITRRYSDFERLHSRLRRCHCDEMEGLCFPRKKLRKNFVAETIAKRSRAFEQYLSHLHSLGGLRRSPIFLEFFYLSDLRAGQMLMRVGRYQEALGALLNALRLQEKLGCHQIFQQQQQQQLQPPFNNPQQETHWLYNLCALVCCFQDLEHLEEAQDHCDRALGDIAPSQEALQRPQPQQHFHPMLIPLLQHNVRLSWKISKDKRRWEALLQEIQDLGVDVGNQPNLREYLIKEALEDSDVEAKSRVKGDDVSQTS